MSFSALGLSENLLKSIREQGYGDPYPVQSHVIPNVLAGRDLLAVTRTGAGKTAAFALPVLQLMQQKQAAGTRIIKVLIIEPSRERAGKVGFSLHKYSKHLGNIKTRVVFSGVELKLQMQGLRGTDILAATPERLAELVEKEAVDLSQVEILVLDEADEALKLGFQKELDAILALLPAERQNLIFTTELNDEVETLANRLLNDPVKLEIEDEQERPEIRQQAYIIDADKKDALLCHLIKEGDWQQVLVFTSFTKKADNIAMKLNLNGIPADAIYGDKSERMRAMILERFARGDFRVLIVTDLIARGLDIPSAPRLVSYELPGSAITYMQRIGRLDIADSEAVAITLMLPEEEAHLQLIEKKMEAEAERIDTSGLNLEGY